MVRLGTLTGLLRSGLSPCVALVATASAPGTVLAHDAHASHSSSISELPITLFAAGLLVLLAGLSLDSRSDVEAVYVNAGIVIGVAGLLAAIGLLLF